MTENEILFSFSKKGWAVMTENLLNIVRRVAKWKVCQKPETRDSLKKGVASSFACNNLYLSCFL